MIGKGAKNVTASVLARLRSDSKTSGATFQQAGESYEYHYGGGGGWGDPLARPAAQVLADVLDEYVSVAAAEREYGVVLSGDLWELTLAVDELATEQRRREIGAAR